MLLHHVPFNKLKIMIMMNKHIKWWQSEVDIKKEKETVKTSPSSCYVPVSNSSNGSSTYFVRSSVRPFLFWFSFFFFLLLNLFSTLISFFSILFRIVILMFIKSSVYMTSRKLLQVFNYYIYSYAQSLWFSLSFPTISYICMKIRL